jgi:hypothetical protein
VNVRKLINAVGSLAEIALIEERELQGIGGLDEIIEILDCRGFTKETVEQMIPFVEAGLRRYKGKNVRGRESKFHYLLIALIELQDSLNT